MDKAINLAKWELKAALSQVVNPLNCEILTNKCVVVELGLKLIKRSRYKFDLICSDIQDVDLPRSDVLQKGVTRCGKHDWYFVFSE